MASAIVPIGAALVLALTAFVALSLRPARRLNAWLCALLLVQAAAVASYGLFSLATSAAEAQLHARLAIWSAIPVPFLTIVVAHALAGGPVRPAARALVGTAGALTAAALVAQLLAPELFLRAIVDLGLGPAMVSGDLLYLLAAATVLAQGYATWILARPASDLDDPARSRARIALLAFSLLPLYSAGFFATFLATTATPGIPLFQLRVALTFAAAGIVALAGWRAFRAASARVRAGAGLASLALVLLGAVDGAIAGAPALARFVPGYERSIALLRVALAALLLVAGLRYGIADAGAAERAHARRVLRASARVALGLAGGAIVIAVGGAGAVALGFGGVVAVALVALGGPTVERPADALTRAVLLPPDDPRAVAERARTYAAAVAASRDAGAEGERYLATLRDDLGISDREHALLVQGVASRESPRYQTVQTLGRGATAQVELAVDEVAGKRVVVKRFTGLRDPAAALREARALAAVRHARVVPFLEVDRRDDALLLVLAYAEGGSARQLLDREGPLPAARAVALTRDLLEGLEALHAAGIVHCDVKPENLLLDAEGRGLLGDFGSARFAAPDVVDATLAGGAAEGSLSTISPEALRGAPPAPARDVYAAGALLYRLLTGEHYVDLAEATVFEARERILLDPPRLPDVRISPEVEAVLRKALAKRPEARFASARAMRDALAHAS